MSHTPIYDELREHRITESTADVPVARRATLRLATSSSGVDNVDQLASRRGLGGRHRRPSS